MAKAAQQLALQILKEECLDLEERYDGYRLDAVRRLGAILQIERERPSAIVKQITEQLDDFGTRLGLKVKDTQGGVG